jgi:PRTRC genetic system protein E
MFKELAPLLRQRSVLLSLTRLEDDTIRVNVFPKKLEESENEALTTPLSVTGTAEELDTQLPSALTEYVGVNLGFSSTLQTVKEQVAAAAKAAKDEGKAKSTRLSSGKTEPVKPGSSAATAQPAKVDEKKAPVAVAKPAVPQKPTPPQTASLFDFGTPSPAVTPSASDAVSDEASEDEEAILAEIDEENGDEGDDIAA